VFSSKSTAFDIITKYPQAKPLHNTKLVSIQVNTTNNSILSDSNQIYSILSQISTITGQLPSIKKAKNNYSAFKIRTGFVIGTLTTLRHEAMINFYSKLIVSVIPQHRNTLFKKHLISDRYLKYSTGFSNTKA